MARIGYEPPEIEGFTPFVVSDWTYEKSFQVRRELKSRFVNGLGSFI